MDKTTRDAALAAQAALEARRAQHRPQNQPQGPNHPLRLPSGPQWARLTSDGPTPPSPPSEPSGTPPPSSAAPPCSLDGDTAGRRGGPTSADGGAPAPRWASGGEPQITADSSPTICTTCHRAPVAIVPRPNWGGTLQGAGGGGLRALRQCAPCLQTASQAETAERAEAQRHLGLRRLREAQRAGGENPALEGPTLGSIEARQGQQWAMAALQGAVEGMQGGIYLVGPPGRGKTALLEATYRSILSSGRVCRWSSVAGYLRAVQAGWGRRGDGPPQDVEIMTAPALMLDDISETVIGAERQRWRVDALAELLHERSDRRDALTIVTGVLRLSQLSASDMLGESVASRLQRWQEVHVTGPDWRTP